MPPKSGGTVYGFDGSSHRLAQEIGKGGQGTVWSLEGQPALVAKFYHAGFAGEDLAKIEAMCRLKSEPLSSVAAWPLTLLRESRNGTAQGLLMRRVTGYNSVHQLYGLKSRLRTFPEAQFPFLLHTAINTARSFATIHDAGQVIGDVNHSNLMISQNATVAMIDCDSFQITEGNRLFPCPVGVPEFTPPELQGLAFAGQKRTTQHDAFGLSVLIFYLLFLGRHPFMGSYDPITDEIRMLDQAIREYRFPYALSDNSPEVRLPHYVPRLGDYPTSVGALFIRAFTKDAFTRSRPAASEWVNVLVALSLATKQCHTNMNHHYFNGLNNCPWCRVEGAIGSAIFGVKITLVRDEAFNLVAIWAQIESVSPVPESLVRPDLKTLQISCKTNSNIPEIISRRRALRLWTIGVVLVPSVAGVAFFNPLFAMLTIVFALLSGVKLWGKGAALAQSFQTEFVEASERYKTAEAAFERMASTPPRFVEEKSRLGGLKADYEQLAPMKAKRMIALEASRKQKQLQHFLERFRLEDERVPMIGDKTKMILYTWGVLDASDVDEKKISGIKGFGPKKVESLVQWRASKEALFRFDPSQPIDPRDINALDQEFSQKASALRASLVTGPQILKQAVSVWQAQRRQCLTTLNASANVLAQAEVDQRALRIF